MTKTGKDLRSMILEMVQTSQSSQEKPRKDSAAPESLFFAEIYLYENNHVSKRINFHEALADLTAQQLQQIVDARWDLLDEESSCELDRRVDSELMQFVFYELSQRIERSKYGHHRNRKLTDRQRQHIRQAKGVTQPELARQYQVCVRTIQRVQNGR